MKGFILATSKNCLRYLIYGLALFVYLVGYNALIIHISPMFMTLGDNSVNMWKSLVVLRILGVFIFGVLLGIEHLLNEKKREGKWYLNVPRIIILGIPSLIFNLSFLVYFNVVKSPADIALEFFVMNMLLFGYLLSSNFSKKSEPNPVTLKSWLRYVIYGLVLFLCLIGLSILMGDMLINRYIFSSEIFVYLIFGALLGIEHLINEKRKGNRWSFNIPRIIIIGIPSLILGTYLFEVFNVEGHIVNYRLINFHYIIPKSMISSSLIYGMLITLFGYLLTSEFSRMHSKSLKD